MLGSIAEVDPLEATMVRDLNKPFSKGEMVPITQSYLMNHTVPCVWNCCRRKRLGR